MSFALHGADASLEDSVSILQQWVETERQISEAGSSWEADKASMESLIDIYTQELADLEEMIKSAEEDTSAAEVRRASLLEQDAQVKAIEGKLIDSLMVAENALKELESLLPQPLSAELSPLFDSLPENPKESKLAIGQRIQPVVAILTQVQKFNQVVTVVEDFREFSEGRTVQTETVYFGLGAAFYVDETNENAGVGIPGPDGWNWQADNSLIQNIRNFVDIYRGTQQARYIEVPVTVK
jgi:cellobiose-specific phosphotransferase system component IIA